MFENVKTTYDLYPQVIGAIRAVIWDDRGAIVETRRIIGAILDDMDACMDRIFNSDVMDENLEGAEE